MLQLATRSDEETMSSGSGGGRGVDGDAGDAGDAGDHEGLTLRPAAAAAAAGAAEGDMQQDSRSCQEQLLHAVETGNAAKMFTNMNRFMMLFRHQKACKTALTHAAEKGDIVILQYLVEFGVIVDEAIRETNPEIRTLLDAKSTTARGNDAMIATVLGLVFWAYLFGWTFAPYFTVFMLVIASSVIWMSGELQQKQANINLLTGFASRGDLQGLKCALDHGVRVNSQNNHGRTALMEAAAHGHGDIVKCLLDEYRADANILDRDGYTALMHAVSTMTESHDEQRVDIINALLQDCRSNVKYTDKYGDSALHLAVRRGLSADVIEQLAGEQGRRLQCKDLLIILLNHLHPRDKESRFMHEIKQKLTELLIYVQTHSGTLGRSNQLTL